MWFIALLIWFIVVNVPIEIIRKYILKKGLWSEDKDIKQARKK